MTVLRGLEFTADAAGVEEQSPPFAGGDLVVEVRNLRRDPDLRVASFEVRAGEVLGIGGPAGAGHSGLLRLVHGIDRPDAGEVRVEGGRLRPGRPDLALAAGMGLAPRGAPIAGLLHCRAVLLDEPTGGVEAGARAAVHRQIARLADAGCAVVVVSVEMHELVRMCTRIVVMRNGRLRNARGSAAIS